MKKFLSAAIIALVVTFAANVCAAYDYDYDPDYVYIAADLVGSGGYKTYLYLPSVDVQEYNPPHYQIAGNFVTIGGKKTTSETWHIDVRRFNWYTKEIFYRNEHGNWQKEDVTGAFRSYWRRLADALFRAAYGIDFYGY